jgi:hypothetical protein
LDNASTYIQDSTNQTQNKRLQKIMPRVGFEPTTAALVLAKTVHALDLAVTAVSFRYYW